VMERVSLIKIHYKHICKYHNENPQCNLHILLIKMSKETEIITLVPSFCVFSKYLLKFSSAIRDYGHRVMMCFELWANHLGLPAICIVPAKQNAAS
jgi:hypothetical protein